MGHVRRQPQPRGHRRDHHRPARTRARWQARPRLHLGPPPPRREDGLGTYPDASVICGTLDLDPTDRRGHTARNPTLLVEVLSPTTEGYDRGEKLAHYQTIESLREVMLVAHDERRIDLWRRVGDHWTQLTFGPADHVTLDSLACTLPVADIYFDPLAD